METQMYKTILVGVDGSDQAGLALKRAIEVARRNFGKVIVTQVIDYQTYSLLGFTAANEQLLEQETEEAKRLLVKYEKYAEEVDFPNIETMVTYGSAKSVLCKELPEKYQVDLIMVGQSGLNAVERFVMGNIAGYISRNASCDVLIVHPEEES